AFEKGGPYLHAEHGGSGDDKQRDRDGGGGKAFPAAGGDEYQRDQHAELRLIGKQPEQDAGGDGLALKLRQSEAQQGSGEEAILPVTQIDEDGRVGEGEEKPEVIRSRTDFFT